MTEILALACTLTLLLWAVGASIARHHNDLTDHYNTTPKED